MIEADDGGQPEPIGRVLRRVLRGQDGERVLGWLHDHSGVHHLLMPQREPMHLAYYQGRHSFYQNILNEMEKDDGPTGPIIAPTE